MNNKVNGQKPQQRVTARPSVYIDVIDLQGQKQIMDIEYATDLHEQLGFALAALTPPGDDETEQSLLPLQPSDQADQADDAEPPAESEDAAPEV